MPVVGLNFTRIEVERKGALKGNVNIHNNVAIKSVEKSDVDISSDKQLVAKFNFEFTSKYEPELGKIIFNGNLLFMDEQKKIKEVIDTWKKEKKVEKELMTTILNTILSKCNIQALILSDSVNLPPPIPLPKVEVNAKESNSYIG